MSGPEHPESGLLELPGDNAAEIRGVLRRVAEEWGTEVPPGSGGRMEFVLPLAAGIRIGTADLRVRVPSAGGRVEWEVLSSEFRTHRSAVVVLSLGAIGGLALVAWPFFPRLQPLAPLGVVLAIAAWLLVSARVKYRGLSQFWDEVAEEVEAEKSAVSDNPADHERGG